MVVRGCLSLQVLRRVICPARNKSAFFRRAFIEKKNTVGNALLDLVATLGQVLLLLPRLHHVVLRLGQYADQVLEDLVLQPALLGRRLQEPPRPLDRLEVECVLFVAKRPPEVVPGRVSRPVAELHRAEHSAIEVPVPVKDLQIGHDERLTAKNKQREAIDGDFDV